MPSTVGPLVYEGQVPVVFVPATSDWGVANIEAPTSGEIAGGENLASYIPKNGISFPSNRNMVDTSAIDRELNSEFPGSRGGTLEITFKIRNRDGDQDAYDLFRDGKVAGDIIFGFEGSLDTGDICDVYRVVGHTPVRNNPGPDEEQRFTVMFGVQDDSLGAEVDGGS